MSVSTNHRSNEPSYGLSGWRLAILLSATQLLAFSDRFLITIAAPAIKIDFALSDAQLGLLQGSAFALIYAGTTLVAGYIVDRGYCRILLLLSVIIWSFATFAMAIVDGFVGLLIARAMLGLGQGAITPAALRLLAYRLPAQGLGRAVSLFTSSSTLGRALALLGGGYVLSHLRMSDDWRSMVIYNLQPWQVLFIIACLPNLMLLPGLWRVIEPVRATRQWNPSALRWMLRFWTAYGPHFVAAAAAVLIGQTLAIWAPTFFIRKFTLTPAETGLSLGIIVLVAAPVGNLLGGHWVDRVVVRARKQACSRLLAVGLLVAIPAVTAMTLTDRLFVSLAAFAVAIASLGVTSPSALAGLQLRTPRRFRGRVSAYFIAAVTLFALGLGPPLVGLVTDRMSVASDIGWAMVLVFTPVALIGSTMAFLTSQAQPIALRSRRIAQSKTPR